MDMAQNYYQWTSERAISVVSLSPFSYTSGMYEVSALDERGPQKSNLELLLENFVLDQTKQNQEFKSQAGILNDSLTKLSSKVDSICTHINQRAPQKFNLELLIENFVLGQTKQNQELKNQTGFLNDSLTKLTSKVDSIVTHNKMLENQISQVAQQVCQTKTNQINDFTLRNGRQLEEPQVKDKAKESEKVSDKPQSEKTMSEKLNFPPPYKPKILFTQRLAKSKLDEKFKKFVECMSLSLCERIGIG